VHRFLVVEDDKAKFLAIMAFIAECFPIHTCAHADSLQAASECLDKEVFDLIVLDMSIPSHSPVAGSGRPYPLPVGGLDILLEVWTSERSERVIILTQFPDIEFDHTRYPVESFTGFASSLGMTNLLATILFDVLGDWKIEAKKVLNLI
jgi:DNA-binding NarL/FixJ family response regulator